MQGQDLSSRQLLGIEKRIKGRKREGDVEKERWGEKRRKKKRRKEGIILAKNFPLSTTLAVSHRF